MAATASNDTTALYPLALVLECSPATRGQAVQALRDGRVLALAATSSNPAGLRGLVPRVLVIDSTSPGDVEVAAIRHWMRTDRGRRLDVVLLGDVSEQLLPLELSELATVYLRKPIVWTKLARAVMQLAHRRRPETTTQLSVLHDPS